jgi:hypothetical protein
MSEDQGRRVGLNESLFREVNEQIESLNRDFQTGSPTMSVICECANSACTDRLEITVSEYEKVRAEPRRYIIVPGHELPEFESIVESRNGWNVVEKFEGAAAALAEETDPRS